MDALHRRLASSAVVCFVAAVAFVAPAKADAIRSTVSYGTDSSGFPATVASDGVTPVVKFTPVSDGTLPDLSQATDLSFKIGELLLSRPGANQTLGYNNQQVYIEVRVPGLNGTSDVGTLLLGGKLNGDIAGEGESHLTIAFDSIKRGSLDDVTAAATANPGFPISLDSIHVPSLTLSFFDGQATSHGTLRMEVQAVPEPSTWLVFGIIGISAWGAKRNRSRRAA